MLKSNLFKLSKNRRYNYTPRYYKGKEEGNLYEFDSKFSKYRDTYNSNDFGKQWQEARLQMRSRKKPFDIVTSLTDHIGIGLCMLIYFRF